MEASLQASSQPQLTAHSSPTKQLFTKESDRKVTQITEPLLTPMQDLRMDEIVEHYQTSENNNLSDKKSN